MLLRQYIYFIYSEVLVLATNTENSNFTGSNLKYTVHTQPTTSTPIAIATNLIKNREKMDNGI